MRGKSKTVIAICMSMCLAVAAPLSCYRIESKAVIAEAVALSAATLAVTYLAASGLNFVFSDMDPDGAKTFVSNKITEYTSETEEPVPLTNFKITPVGSIVFGAVLAQWMSGFADWLVQENNITDNSVTSVGEESGYYLTNTGIKVFRVDMLSSELDTNHYRTTPYYNGNFYDYSYYAQHLGENIPNQNKPRLYIGSSIYNGNGYSSIDLVADSGSTSARSILSNVTSSPQDSRMIAAIPLITSNNVLFWEGESETGKYYAWTRGGAVDVNRFYDDVSIVSGVKVNAGVMDIPRVVAETDYDVGIEVKQPAGVATVGVGADAVPVPLTDAQVWENIMALVAANSAQAVAYTPTKERIETFPAVVNVNTAGYDIPLTDEEMEDVTAVGDITAAMDLVGDAVDWFIGLFNWDQIKTKFPFSVPYDVWLLFSTFTSADYDILGGTLPSAPVENVGIRKASNNAPVYEMQVPFMYDKNHNLVTGTVTLDFSAIDPIRPLIRAGCGILFTAVLLLFIV